MKKKAAPKKAVAERDSTPDMAPALHRDVETALNRARKTSKWLVAVFSIVDGQVILDRTAREFPKEDINTVVTLLQQDLKQLT